MFKRPEENILMLEQYLADLEASYVLLADGSKSEGSQVTPPSLAEAGKVIDKYRDYRAAKAAREAAAEMKAARGPVGETSTGQRFAPLPDWNEAFVAEQLIARALPKEEARSELARQLAELKKVDLGTHSELLAEWEAIKSDDQKWAAGVHGLLASALRAAQWRNSQRWIIRQLATHYAAELRNAFLFALALGVGLIVLDAFVGPALQSASLAGLGFAVAAGLLGASFSAMMGQGQLSQLDNIEEARAATTTKMLALRLGVGTAAAIIVYFFFESGLAEGALFPNLQNIGFGRVRPLPAEEFAALKANLDAFQQTASGIVDSINAASAKIDATLASAPLGGKDEVVADLGGAASAAASPEQLRSALDAVARDLRLVNDTVVTWKADWDLDSRPLGSVAPNADLSKLVVWCFAAGFTQSLVPSLLARVAPPTKT